jgi:putative DNA primase/helicase
MNIVQLNTTKANNLDQDTGSSAILVKASELSPKPIEWFWKGWIASKILHLLGGVAGTGKTLISILIGSIITRGGRFPDGTTAPLGQVVMWTGEDDICDTLTPRLMAMGADLNNFHFVQGIKTGAEERPFDPSVDMQLLIQEIAKLDNVKLLIIDPIVSVVKGDSHKNAEVRKDLTPLVQLAESSGIAILGITHFSKGTTGREPIERITGSLAFGAVARIVLVASKSQNEDGEDTRIFIRAKSNIGMDEGGFEYSIEPVNINSIDTSKIVWGRTLEGSARELLGNAEEESSSGGIEGCMSLITELIADGSVSAKEIEKDCKDNGYSFATIRRAKKKLGIKSRKSDKKEGLKGVWLWEAPKMLNMLNDAHSQNMNALYKNERLDEDYTN